MFSKAFARTTVRILIPRGNHRHGSYNSGDKLLSRQQCFENFLESKDDTYFANLVEDMAFDQDVDEVSIDAKADAEVFLESKAVRARGEFARTL